MSALLGKSWLRSEGQRDAFWSLPALTVHGEVPSQRTTGGAGRGAEVVNKSAGHKPYLQVPRWEWFECADEFPSGLWHCAFVSLHNPGFVTISFFSSL